MDNGTLVLSKENPPKFPKLIEQFMIHARDIAAIPLENTPYSWHNVISYDWLNDSQKQEVIAWFFNINQTAFDRRATEFVYAWVSNNYEVSEGLEKYVVVLPNMTYYDGSPLGISEDGEVDFGEPVEKACDGKIFAKYDTALKVAKMIGGAVEGFFGGNNGHEWPDPLAEDENSAPETVFPMSDE